MTARWSISAGTFYQLRVSGRPGQEPGSEGRGRGRRCRCRCRRAGAGKPRAAGDGGDGGGAGRPRRARVQGQGDIRRTEIVFQTAQYVGARYANDILLLTAAALSLTGSRPAAEAGCRAVRRARAAAWAPCLCAGGGCTRPVCSRRV